MPYIKQEERNHIDPILKKLLVHMGPLTQGQIVYILYQIALWYSTKGGVEKNPVNWTTCNEVIGCFDSASKEFYRRVVGPYEDQAIEKNGDCEPYIFKASKKRSSFSAYEQLKEMGVENDSNL